MTHGLDRLELAAPHFQGERLVAVVADRGHRSVHVEHGQHPRRVPGADAEVRTASSVRTRNPVGRAESGFAIQISRLPGSSTR